MPAVRVLSGDRWRWMAFPLGLFLSSRLLYVALGWFEVLYASRFGRTPQIPARLLAPWAPLSLLGSGDLAAYARIAQLGYQQPEDTLVFPLLPGLAWLVSLAFPVAPTLVVLGNLACAAAFAVIFALYDELEGPSAARWGLGLLAAFPFAFHLADGGALAWVALSTAGAALLAQRGRLGLAALVATAGALAHPAALAAVIALVALRSRSPVSPLARLALALAPLAVPLAWGILVVSGVLRKLPATFFARFAALPSRPWLWAMLPWTALVIAGVLLLLIRPGPRWLAAATVATVALLFLMLGPPMARALAVCWAALLPLGALAARSPSLGMMTLATAGLHQGVYLFFHTYQLPPT